VSVGSRFNAGSRGAKCPSGVIIQIVAVGLLMVGLGLGCGGGKSKPAEICLSLEAASNLNSFDEQAHVVVVYFYPLQNVMAFNAMDSDELLNGGRPPGLTGDPWETTVYPGQKMNLEEKLPRDTVFLGVLADFYSGPSRAVVEADCSLVGNQKIVLSSRDLQID